MLTIDVQGHTIPKLGFGTWQLSGRTAYDAVAHALELGYRHIDTAQMYGNEDQVGQAITDSGVDRDDIWLTTKLDTSNLRAEDVRRTTDQSLRRLQTDRIDLLLIHWPSRSVPLEETLGAMREVREAGKVRALGVSNFPPSLVEEALGHADIVADQVEYHPYLSQDQLRKVAVENDLMLTAYSPLAKGRVVRDETLADIGDAHGKNAAQVAIRWLLQQDNVVPIPRSSSAEHRASNFDVFDFELSDDEMAAVAALNRDDRIIDPGMGPDWER